MVKMLKAVLTHLSNIIGLLTFRLTFVYNSVFMCLVVFRFL